MHTSSLGTSAHSEHASFDDAETVARGSSRQIKTSGFGHYINGPEGKNGPVPGKVFEFPNFDALCEDLLDNPPGPEVAKQDLALLSGSTFEDNLRCEKRFLGADVIGFDLDARNPTEVEVRQALAPYRAFAYTTTSSLPGALRWRALVLTSRTITSVKAFEAVQAAIAKDLRRIGAVGSSDCARQFFIPRQSAYEGVFIAFQTYGEPVDVDAIITSVPEERRPATAPASGPRLVALAVDAKSRAAAVAMLAAAWPEGGNGKGDRHSAQRALAGALLWGGWYPDEVVDFLCDVCRAAGNEDRAKRESTVESTLRAIQEKKNVTRWGNLRTLLPPLVVDGARKALGLSDDSTPAEREWLQGRGNAKSSLFDALKEQGKAYDAQAPEIELGSDLHRVVEEACKALAGDSKIFVREGKLVQMITVSGIPMIREIPLATLRSELTRVAAWRKTNEKGMLCNTVPPPEVVAAVAEVRVWPAEMRRLDKIVETPVLRADGSVLQEPGYDAATGFFYEPGGARFGEVPTSPTREDAQRAFQALYEPFAEFACEESGKAVAIAAVLTSLAMGALEGEDFPAFVFDANVQGAGKGLSTKVVSLICTGRVTPPQSFPSVDKTELEKILSGVARDGYPLVNFDNINSPFGGDALEGRMTCGGYAQSRVLGRSETVRLPWRTIVMGTGNNINLTRDMCRRVLRCRIVRLEENPQLKTEWRIPDLPAWIRANRPRLVVAGLTILRAFYAAGCPDQGTTWGSFEKWASLVAGAIKWASGIDVLDARVQMNEALDPSTAAFAAFLAAWPENMLGRWKSLAELDRRPLLTPNAAPEQRAKNEEALSFQGVRDVFDDIVEGEEKGRKLRLGKWLAKRAEQVIGERQLLVHINPSTKVNEFRVRRL